MRALFTLVTGSIRGRLIAGVLLLHAVLMGLVVADMLSRQQRFMESQVASEGQALANMLALNATTWLLSNDLSGLDELTDDLRAQRHIQLAMILDRTGKVRASTDPTLFNVRLNDPASQRLIRETDESGPAGQSQFWHDGTLDSLATIRAGTKPIGYARVILDAAAVQAELDAVLNKGAAYTVAAILIGGFMAWLLVRTMTYRLGRLSQAADAISYGNLSVTLPDYKGDDEVSRLTREFNAMARALERDREEQNRLVRQLDRANQELTRLARISAHHLQEPVRRLVTFAQRLRSQGACSAANDELQDSIDHIETDGKYLHALIRDIQAYLAATQTPKSPGSADANTAAERACRRLHNAIEGAQAKIELEALPPALIDSQRLADIFTILIDNAVKYRRPDVPLAVTVAAHQGGRFIRYQVTDNGIGIPADHREKVFQVFERLHPSDVYPGTGIGLAILRRIVESYDGRAWIEEAPMGGTRVVVQLPAPEPEAA